MLTVITAIKAAAQAFSLLKTAMKKEGNIDAAITNSSAPSIFMMLPIF